MSFLNRVKAGLYRFMMGRYGADKLGLFLIWGAVIVSLIGSLTGLAALSLISMLMWAFALFRMLSRNLAARRKENDRFLSLWQPVATSVRQACARFKNRRQFRYFRCPHCHAWLKLPRGVGQVTMKCGKCAHQFDTKA